MAKRVKPSKAKIKTWLKSKGHNSAATDREIDTKVGAAGLRALHGITDDEYRNAGGRE
jgi:hypothetical protein